MSEPDDAPLDERALASAIKAVGHDFEETQVPADVGAHERDLLVVLIREWLPRWLALRASGVGPYSAAERVADRRCRSATRLSIVGLAYEAALAAQRPGPT